MDETYQVYINRLVELTLPSSYTSQLQNIQKSPKFVEQKPVQFPGYSIITPPGSEDEANKQFYEHIETVQQQLVKQLPSELLITLPSNSFHLTLADLIWDVDYKAALSENPNFESQLCKCINDSFTKYQETNTSINIQWQVLGLLVFPRALAIGLVPKTEQDYQQIINLRRSIYQNVDLISLGLEQRYYFAAHITIGYFNDIDPDLDRSSLVGMLTRFNDQWMETDPLMLNITKAELRQFSNMIDYKRAEDWPSLDL